MQTRRSKAKNRRQRSGFTWVELIVCIAIVGMLVALVIPTIRTAKPAARRAQCQSNLRNLGIAVQAYATTHHGEIPPLLGKSRISTSRRLSAGENRSEASWLVTLFPYLEEASRYDQLRVGEDGRGHPAESIHVLAQQNIFVLNCPNADPKRVGGNSYVANAGIIPADLWHSANNDADHRGAFLDLGFNGYGGENHNADDATAAMGTGVFWQVPIENGEQDAAASKPLTLDEISAADGTSQTVLLSENVNTRSYDPQTREGGWISSSLGDIAFGIAVPGKRVGTAFQVATSDQDGGLGGARGELATSLTLSQNPIPSECVINANLGTAKKGMAPRPSSLHLGVVNMAFADGSCKVISEKISPSVYARLLSPSGGRYGQEELADEDF